MPTRCCMPPLRWPGSRTLEAGEADGSRIAPSLGGPLDRSDAAHREPEFDVAAPVFHGNGGAVVNIMPSILRPAPRRARRPPSPARTVGLREPATALSTVVLPQPDGPSSATNSPGVVSG